MPYSDCGKRFEVELFIQGTKRLQKLDVPLCRQTGMETSNHMDLGDPLIQSVSCCTLNFRNRHLERMRIASACTEGAKLAGKHANIRGIDVTVQAIACPGAGISRPDD